MNTEEFQKIVLEELRGLKEGQEEIKKEQQEMKKEQQEIKRDLKAVIEQTANLTEFKQEINDTVAKMTYNLNIIELVVSKNWNDITGSKIAR